MKHTSISQPSDMAGLFTMSLRLVVGWTYFSAFWRRLILENKLIPEEAGYIGEKFNHFLPNAIGIKPVIEYLVSHPDELQVAMIAFTIVEALVGLFIMLGLFTRLMGIGVFALAMGILLGSGWIGTTCLDEWQIGVLGVAAGFTIFLSGSGAYSLDHYLMGKGYAITKKRWFGWIGSGTIPAHKPKRIVLAGSVLILMLTLYTNQVFHGGVWGTLHNKSVKPKIEISTAELKGNQLTFGVYRTEGVDVYGSFLIGIQILNNKDQVIFAMDGKALSKLSKDAVHNHYVAKVRPGKHSLVIPLGAKAELNIPVTTPVTDSKDNYTLKLIDISGAEWTSAIRNE